MKSSKKEFNITGKYFNYLTVHCDPNIIIQWMMLREVEQNKVQKIKKCCHVSVAHRIYEITVSWSPNSNISKYLYTKTYNETIASISPWFPNDLHWLIDLAIKQDARTWKVFADTFMSHTSIYNRGPADSSLRINRVYLHNK